MGLPYRPPSAEPNEPVRPTLEQLRSSFSPPDQNPNLSAFQNYNFGPTATGNGLGLHGPAAFATSPILPQNISAPIGMYPAPNMNNGQFTTVVPSPQMYNNMPFQPQGMEQYQPYIPPNTVFQPRPNPFQTTPTPSTSEITPEVAAALLKQLQLQNPQLLEKIIGEQQSNGHGSGQNGQVNVNQANPIGIPAPPPPGSTVSRPNKNLAQRSNSTGSGPKAEDWPNGVVPSTSEDKVEGDPNEPVWVMRYVVIDYGFCV